MLASLVKAVALLNAPFREHKNGIVTATKFDLGEALRLWKPLQVSQHYGVTQQVWNFYVDVIVKLYLAKKKKPLTSNEISAFYHSQYNEFIGGDTLRKNYVPALLTTELISMEKGIGGDARVQYIIPNVLPSVQKEDHIEPVSQNEGVISFGLDKSNNSGIIDQSLATISAVMGDTQLTTISEDEPREGVKDTRKEDYIM